MDKKKKYVVVLAHADGWGAVSANKVVRHLHEHYPDVGVILVVSQATKNEEGKIITKLGDLELARELKETKMLEYFQRIDAMYDRTPTMEQLDAMAKSGRSSAKQARTFQKAGRDHAYQYAVEMCTFKQLAKRYCADHEVHYTTRGGFKGGTEVAEIFRKLELEQGITPEVVLSVDTMAILPAEITSRYHCFSTHPGPLDTIKVEGMQGTLRSLAYQVLYDRNGEPLPADHVFGMGEAHLKGTLFLQHPELDKGPPIATVQSFICPGVCAYHARDSVYAALVDEMIDRLPVLLDAEKRGALVAQATEQKKLSDAGPHTKIPELTPEKFATWQGSTVGFANGAGPWGVEVIQNAIVNPHYFKNQMRAFFPGSDKDFNRNFNSIYAGTLEQIAEQQDERLTEPWARVLAGKPGANVTEYDVATHQPIATYSNPPGKRKPARNRPHVDDAETAAQKKAWLEEVLRQFPSDFPDSPPRK